jgi:paraquat-inducible protein B
MEADRSAFSQRLQSLEEQLSVQAECYEDQLASLQQHLDEAQRELCESKSKNERDRALLDGKIQFLEQQKDQAKRDYLEASRKFDETRESIYLSATKSKPAAEPQDDRLRKQLQEEKELG